MSIVTAIIGAFLAITIFCCVVWFHTQHIQILLLAKQVDVLTKELHPLLVKEAKSLLHELPKQADKVLSLLEDIDDPRVQEVMVSVEKLKQL